VRTWIPATKRRAAILGFACVLALVAAPAFAAATGGLPSPLSSEDVPAVDADQPESEDADDQGEDADDQGEDADDQGEDGEDQGEDADEDSDGS
jgi:hypothetical protein